MDNPLLCVTPDNMTCCSTAKTGGAPLGSWYFPNKTAVPPDSIQGGCFTQPGGLVWYNCTVVLVVCLGSTVT